MAGQKTQRPAKRHLVRWNDELDRKLVLAIQYVCNADGIRIPWDKVGIIMGEGISDGAVIQHLAKLRQRMVSHNISVPPPLRRGGGYAVPTSGSSSSALSKNTKKATGTQVSGSTAVSQKKGENFDVDKASESDADFEKTCSKRVKQDSKGKRRNPKVNKGESDEEEESDSGMVGAKRKRQRGETGSAPSKGRKKENAKTSKPAVRARRSTIKYGELSDSDSDEEYADGHSEGAEHDTIEEGFVAARATFLRSESSHEENEGNDSIVSLTPKKAISNRPSKIVVLQIGNSERARNFLEDLEYLSGDEPDLDSESQEGQDEAEDDISEGVSNANVATMNNPEMVNEQAESVDQPYRDEFHPSGNNFSNAMALPHTTQATAHNLVHHSMSHQLSLLNSAPTSTKGISLYAGNSTMANVQGVSYQYPVESFNGQNFTNSGNLPTPSAQGGVYDFSGHTSGGQTIAPSWINEAGDRSIDQISSHHGVHRYSTAGFDSTPNSSSLYVPTPNGSGYNTPNNLNRSTDRIGNQHTMAMDQRANCESSGFLHSDMARPMSANLYSRDVLGQSVGSHYQSYFVDHDLNHGSLIPAAQQQRMLSSSTRDAGQPADGPSMTNQPFSATSTATSNFDLSSLDNVSAAGFEYSQAHFSGQDQGDTQGRDGNVDEYSSMMDAFDFAAFDENFGNDNPFL